MSNHTKKKIEKSIKKSRRNKIIFVISFLILLAIIPIYMIYNSIENENIESKPFEPKFVKNGKLIFLKNEKNEIIKSIDIEVADNEAKRTQGLMWRRSMLDSVGMLFIFEIEEPLSFWMKNTYISLDIIYVNKSLEIVTIRDNTTPFSEVSLPSDKPSQYVIEVNAGFCYNYKIETGDKIKFEIQNINSPANKP
jgi:uncharacterized protein